MKKNVGAISGQGRVNSSPILEKMRSRWRAAVWSISIRGLPCPKTCKVNWFARLAKNSPATAFPSGVTLAWHTRVDSSDSHRPHQTLTLGLDLQNCWIFPNAHMCVADDRRYQLSHYSRIVLLNVRAVKH